MYKTNYIHHNHNIDAELKNELWRMNAPNEEIEEFEEEFNNLDVDSLGKEIKM